MLISLIFSILLLGSSNPIYPIQSSGLSNVDPCDKVPVVNQRILAYVKSNHGKRIGRGECWDLAAHALNNGQASWDGKYAFGKKVNYKTECIFPGDILQFEKVVLESQVGTQSRREEMMHHTAIVYEVLGPGKYVIAHQNSNGVKKIVHTELNLEFLKKGTITFFRPQA